MRKILVANPKGGVGKTTLATNLAGWFAKQGLCVMLGDLDRQQSSRGWLSVRPPSLPFIHGWDMARGEPARPPKGTTDIVLDAPAGLHGKRLKHILERVDRVIVPLQPSIFDIYATRQFLDELQEMRRVRNDSIQIGLVGMRVKPRTLAAAEIDRFLHGTGLTVLTCLRDTQNYVRLAAHGMTVFDLPEAQAQHDLQSWEPMLSWLDS